MNSFQRAFATLLLVGALVTGSGWSAAWAQDGDASGEVDITEEAGEAAKPEEKPAAKSAMKMPKPKLTDRDPFRNPILSGEVGGDSIPVYDEEGATIDKTGGEKSTAGGSGADGVETVVYSDEEEEEIEPPAFEISGIVSSGSGRRAILAGPESTHIVSVGDKLAEFKVASITSKTVVLKYKDREFKVEINDEFGLRD